MSYHNTPARFENSSSTIQRFLPGESTSFARYTRSVVDSPTLVNAFGVRSVPRDAKTSLDPRAVSDGARSRRPRERSERGLGRRTK